tara:strand:+ start:165 stop:338 length:174 start_codon:yes stop_codon:yes gene_type:complete
MKKFIPYLLFTSATIHAIVGIAPVMAMGCSADSEKTELICEEGDLDCQKKVIESRIN